MAGLPTSDLRARRFPLRLALQYRSDEAGDWYPATTENISLSGVLFRCRHSVPARSTIELSLQLPSQLSGPVPVRIFGTACVVRVAQPTLRFRHSRIAATFLQFRLPQGDTARSSGEVPLQPGTQHKLYNLLAVILGTTELLLDRGDLPADLRVGISRIQDAAMSLTMGLRRLSS